MGSYESDKATEGKHVDLASSLPSESHQAGRRNSFLGIHFACCSVYRHIYLNRQGTAYVGHCPRCGRPVQVRVDPRGSDSRFFTAY